MPFSFKEYAQEHYFAEIERKKELNSNVSTPVTLASAYAAAILTMVGSIRTPISCLDVSVLIGCGLAALALLCALYFLLRSYVGHAYMYVATPDCVQNWRQSASAGGWTGKALDDATEGMLATEYANAAAHNAGVNDRKSGFLHQANLSLGAVLVLLIVAAVPWMIEKIQSEAHKEVQPSMTLVINYAGR